MRVAYIRRYAQLLLVLSLALSTSPVRMPAAAERHFLYVANPGTRNYVEYGGVGILVYHLSQALARLGHHVDIVHCVDAYFAKKKKRNPGHWPHHAIEEYSRHWHA